MSKRIAFCADGTWDTSSKHTNVYKLYKSLLVGADQMPFYDDGVGADGNPIIKVVGGAFGTGIWNKIKEGYTKIAHVYEKDDAIFIFGFSRGAYTARSLAGMITACGLPTENFTDDLVDKAFDAYRDREGRADKLKQLSNYAMYCPKITMVGVWDTVGSLGIPSLFSGVDPIAYGFLDTGLHPNILNAYHALALDEMRCEFRPTLWTGEPAAGQTVEQVWFCGVHSDVGGGEPDAVDGTPALSDITLSWMMSKASALGLQIDPAVQAQYSVPLDTVYANARLHTSWNIACGPEAPRQPADNAAIANSIVLRLQTDKTWQPRHLKLENGALASGYQVVNVLREPAAAAGAQGAGAQSAGS